VGESNTVKLILCNSKLETMAQRSTTSIKVDPELWREFRKYAIDKGKTVSELIEEFIKGELRKEKA